MTTDTGGQRTGFRYPDTARRLRGLEAAHPGARLVAVNRTTLRLAAAGETLATVHLPAVVPIGAGEEVDAYLRRLESPLGVEVVLLLRAGSAALGLWRDGELAAHKVFTRYVTRGSGRAQPTHLRTKGKSRYGARLRLQNARRLLGETNERLTEWWHEHGAWQRLFVACQQRLWADLLAAAPPPPFVGRLLPTPVAMHVHEPRHAELLRVRARLERGAVVGG